MIFIEGLLGYHTNKISNSLKFGFLLFLVRELIFFFRIFWFFFDIVIVPRVDLGEIWNPFGLLIINPFGLPFLNTFLLLRRAFFLTWSHNSFLNGEGGKFRIILRLILGLFFLFIQSTEYI